MINAAAVLDYLKQNPSFFQQHETILVELGLMDRDKSAPFIERQIEVLKTRESEQKAKLDMIVDSARSNLKLEDDFLEIVIRLLSIDQSSGSAMDIVSSLLVKQFNVKKAVVLLQMENMDSRHAHYDEIRQRVTHKSSICDDRISSSLLQALFDSEADHVKSCAFIPLLFDDEIKGVLVLGSSDRERFNPEMGVNFLDKLGLLVGAYLQGKGDGGS